MIDTLQGAAAFVAAEIQRAFPDVVFTSCRRSVADQARVMAGNVAQNRKWIEQTYLRGRAAIECQDFVDRNPAADRAALVTGFATIIGTFGDDDLRRLSRHLSGEAFDVKPMGGARGEEVSNALKDWAFKKGGKFLTREGGLDVWHWQGP